MKKGSPKKQKNEKNTKAKTKPKEEKAPAPVSPLDSLHVEELKSDDVTTDYLARVTSMKEATASKRTVGQSKEAGPSGLGSIKQSESEQAPM